MSRLLLALLAVILIIEEWLWDALTFIGHYLARLMLLATFERWLSQSSPTVAVIAFSIPLLIVTPINLAAFFLFAHGLFLQGLGLEIIAKLLGTLLIARVFALTKPQLLTFSAINWLYRTISGWLHWAHEQIHHTAVYQAASRLKAAVKVRLASWLPSVPRDR